MGESALILKVEVLTMCSGTVPLELFCGFETSVAHSKKRVLVESGKYFALSRDSVRDL